MEPDREELARAGDRRPQPFGRRDQRQRGEIDRAERAQALGRQFGGAETGDHARAIANPAIGVDRAGFFVAGVSETPQLHGVVPSIVMGGDWAGAYVSSAWLHPTLTKKERS